MEVYTIEGAYCQRGDDERFFGELGVDGNIVKGHIDDIDQSMLPEPNNDDLRNKVVEGEYYPENNAIYLVKRGFDQALRNVEKSQDEQLNPQEVHMVAQTPEDGVEGHYEGIWTIGRPEELRVQYLGDDDFEMGWEIDPEQYENDEMTAQELIDDIYGGTLPQEPEEINTDREISRGTTQFRIDPRLSPEVAQERLPMDIVNVALDGGIDNSKRVT